MVDEGSGDAQPLHGSQVSAELLADAVEAALSAVCSRLPKSFAVSYSNGASFALPVGLIDIDGILDSATGVFIPQVQVRANEGTFSNPNTSGNGWMLYCPPTFDPGVDENGGVVTLIGNIPSDKSVTVYYTGNWPVPSKDSDVISTPPILITPLALFGASYCIIQDASRAARLRQYNTKVDSGVPTNNPLIDQSNFLLKRYEIELTKVPMRTSGVK